MEDWDQKGNSGMGVKVGLNLRKIKIWARKEHVMFECWEHWKEEKSWPDMMMSVAACDGIMWPIVLFIHWSFIMDLNMKGLYRLNEISLLSKLGVMMMVVQRI